MLFQAGAALIVLYILLFIFFLIFITIFLKIGLSFTSAENTGFGAVLPTAFLCTLAMWALIVLFSWFFGGLLWFIISVLIGLLICWAIIAKRHDIGYGAAILVTIIAVIAAVVIIIILILVFGFLAGLAAALF